MKFTLGWLKDHLETEASLEEIVERLSMLGLEVESVEDRAAELRPFTVARVISADPHPNADRLKVCRVETAEGEVQVVCGAPNARSGMWAVFAPVGSYIPGTDLDLRKGVIRGVESNGMLLSERELGLSDEHEGIIDLGSGEGLSVGQSFAVLQGLDDPVIEIAITPNRGDCLGVRGIARDLAAAGLGRLKSSALLDAMEGSFQSPIEWRRDLPEDRQDACPYVAGRFFRGVRNGPSPKWLQDRLKAIGLRPISALVDITNYVTFDLGRPLHVFDADKLRGHLTMRFAREGEEILALDGRTYDLDSETLVIADERGPQGIAGVMGGELSGCTEETRNVFLEVALFDPIMVAFTGRRLSIHSDARYRFERGLDPKSAQWGVDVATRLILELCGGEASHSVSAGEIPQEERSIRLRPQRTASLGGVEIAATRQQELLERLGFDVTATEEGELNCRVPSWRSDIEGEACLVEEVLRLHGYDAIPVVSLPREDSLPRPALDRAQKREAEARMALAWAGLDEAVTFSFISEAQARQFGWNQEALRLDNPISADLNVMRPSVLPTLLEAAVRNSDRGYGDIGLFEVGPQYAGTAPENQSSVAAALRMGQAVSRHWLQKARPVDLFDAKADALRVLEALGAPIDNLQVSADAPQWYHPGRSGGLRLGPKILAWFGELHPRVLRSFGARGTVVASEVFLEAVPLPKQKEKAKPPADLPAFQPVERDFAFVMDEDVPAEKAVRAAKAADRQLVQAVQVFDVYRGSGLPEGSKSVALAVTLQPRDKTLTEADLEVVSAKIVQQVTKATGGTLRA